MTDSIHGDEKNYPYLTDNHVQVQINPTMNPMSVKWAPQNANYRMGAGYSPYDFSTNPVFCSKRINTLIKEALIPCTIQLDIKFVMLSRANAYDLLNRLYSRYAPGEMIVVNDFIFEYKIPDDVVSLLYYLYKQAKPDDVEDVKEYLGKFIPWLKNHSGNKIMLVMNRNSQDIKELAIRKNAFNTIGQIDLTLDKPESDKTNQSTLTYSIPLQYTIQFSRPTAMLVDFPIICNNELVDDAYLSIGNMDAKHPTGININKTLECVHQRYKPVRDDYNSTIMLPWYDDWMVPTGGGMYSFNFFPFLCAAFTLDDTDNPEGVTEIDLNDGFDEYTLKDHVLEAYRKQGSDSLIPWGEYMVQVYANNDLVDASMLEWDNTKITIKNRDKSKLYHLVLSKREVDYGVNQTKRVWISDIITARECGDKAGSDTQREVRCKCLT
jgi:hypothetical protein